MGNIEIFGESMYGIHSIAYNKLESYFYVFAVRENNRWLSWEEVKFYASLFDFPTVPEIPIKYHLRDFVNQNTDEDKSLSSWLTKNLGMTWEEYTDTPGLLEGFDPTTNKACSEGIVIRNMDSYETNNGDLPVEKNEFDNLFKIVRASHVKTDVHWTKTWKPARLINYDKYKWYSYQYNLKQ